MKATKLTTFDNKSDVLNKIDNCKVNDYFDSCPKFLFQESQ